MKLLDGILRLLNDVLKLLHDVLKLLNDVLKLLDKELRLLDYVLTLLPDGLRLLPEGLRLPDVAERSFRFRLKPPPPVLSAPKVVRRSLRICPRKSSSGLGGHFIFQRLELFVQLQPAGIVRGFGDQRAVIFQRLGIATLRGQFLAEREPEADFLLRRGI